MKYLLAGAGASMMIILIIFATGATFGQRCNRMFPTDPIAAERCVYDLSNGQRP